MRLNPNKLFRWLSIRSKLIIAFVGLSLLPLFVIGAYAVITKIRMMEAVALENLTHDVHNIRERTGAFFSTVESDMMVLRDSRLLENFIVHADQNAGQASTGERRQVEEEFLSFASSKRVYYQLRVVGSDGTELLRIEQKGPIDSLSSFSAVPTERLRTSREAYSFLLASELGDEQIAFAPAELITAEDELLAVFTFVTPLREEGGRDGGLLIVNVFARDLFRAVERHRHLAVEGKIAIISRDGYYLYHSVKKSDWNRLLATREEDVLQKNYPRTVTDAIFSGNMGTVSEGIDEIITYAPLFDSPTVFANSCFVLESVSKNAVLGPVYSSAFFLGALLFAFLGLSAVLALLATRQFTRPVRELQRSAEIVARGDYGHRIHVETHDEIEVLARQFNLMAGALEERGREIESHRARLEEMVVQRTRELSEEKTKLQAILDNVPTAFVLLDSEFRILSASAAFESVTGLSLDAVKGKDCTEVFCKGGFCRSCICREAVSSGMIQSHFDHTVGRNGQERYIEHVAIPMKEDGQPVSLLEMITDVTRRRKFEENAIRTERLMAVGELSAFIAHEIRNSLTSIKMILQLQKESAGSRRLDKKALGVALDSIYHLEGVVTELLNFARPSPFAFRKTSLNDVIAESIAFIHPHLSMKRVTLRRKLSSSLPPMVLDVTHLREALVNLLLNAVQALNGHGTISVVTARKRLRKTLRDYAYLPPGESDSVLGMQGQKEIILAKGWEVAVVEIVDSGKGIDRRNLKKIFEPFFSTKSGGSGLGLPMAKRVVNAHGGLITVENGKGQGSKFTVVLPLVNEMVGKDRPPGKKEPA